MKESSIGPSIQSLGGKLREEELENGQKCWAFGSKQYVEAVVKNVTEYLKKRGDGLTVKAVTPMTSGYRPKIDITPELGEEYASYFHYLIGILIWIVELGRVDINVEASIMSSHLEMPREEKMQ